MKLSLLFDLYNSTIQKVQLYILDLVFLLIILYNISTTCAMSSRIYVPRMRKVHELWKREVDFLSHYLGTPPLPHSQKEAAIYNSSITYMIFSIKINHVIEIDESQA